MKRIGEISKTYNISNRMLRYYEQVGIIRSIRKENNYRYYSSDTEQKLKQILLLKELDFTLKEIEQIYQTQSIHELLKIMHTKKQRLQSNIKELQQLELIITNFISLLSTNKSIFESLSLSLETTNLIERGKQMNNENLRIITLPKMKVAVFHKVSETPEDDCWAITNQFIKENNLESFRHFGFNNPNPSKDSPTYGYEMWVTIPNDFNTSIPTKEITSGLYASLTTTMDKIGERWKELYQLVDNHDLYSPDYSEDNNHQWLEECTNYEHFINPDIHFSEKQLDLLLPITKKLP